MLIHKFMAQTPYTAFPLDWQVWEQENTVYSAFSIFISWWSMDLVGKQNTKSPIWNHLHWCHPSAFAQVSSSSLDRKRPAGQVCNGEAFSKLAKYEQDSGKWKMLTRNVATYSRDSYSTESTCSRRGVNAPACLVAEQWTVSKPDAV